MCPSTSTFHFMFYLQIQADIIEYSTLKFKVAVQELLKRHGNVSTVELQWLEHPCLEPWNMFETGEVRANECWSLCQVRRHNRDIFSIFLNMKVCWVFSLETPHWGDWVHTIYHFQCKIENQPKLTQICSCGISFQGTQEPVRNIWGKRAISIQATEVLLHYISP